MSKLSDMDELNIITGRALGQTYDEIRESTGHSNSTISRVLKTENLLTHVLSLYHIGASENEKTMFYKKWLHRTLWAWAIVSVIQVLFIL